MVTAFPLLNVGDLDNFNFLMTEIQSLNDIGETSSGHLVVNSRKSA